MGAGENQTFRHQGKEQQQKKDHSYNQNII